MFTVLVSKLTVCLYFINLGAWAEVIIFSDALCDTNGTIPVAKVKITDQTK